MAGVIVMVAVGRLLALLPEGSFCTTERACLSSRCVDNVCEPPQQAPEILIQ